jgi:Zn-dependent protease
VLLWLPLLLLLGRSLRWAILAVPALLFLLLVHEAGHAMVARLRGVKVHAIRLYFFHGACEHDVPRSEVDQACIAWGGVLAQSCLLAMALLAAWVILHVAMPVYKVLAPVFVVWVATNLFIIVFNLLPVRPLDGSVAWRGVPLIWRQWRGRSRQPVSKPKVQQS